MENFGQLKAEIQSYVNREDAEFVERIPSFIRLAESAMYRKLRSRDNEFTVTYSRDDAGFEFKKLPQNFRELRQITWNGRDLHPTSPEVLSARLEQGSDREPFYFALFARELQFSDRIEDDPANWNVDDELTILYYGTESLNDLPTWSVPTNPVEDPVSEQTGTALSQSDSNTTRMLRTHPDAYLAGALEQAYRFVQDPSKAAEWGQLFRVYLEEIEMESNESELAGGTALAGIPYAGETYR